MNRMTDTAAVVVFALAIVVAGGAGGATDVGDGD